MDEIEMTLILLMGSIDLVLDGDGDPKSWVLEGGEKEGVQIGMLLLRCLGDYQNGIDPLKLLLN